MNSMSSLLTNTCQFSPFARYSMRDACAPRLITIAIRTSSSSWSWNQTYSGLGIVPFLRIPDFQNNRHTIGSQLGKGTVTHVGNLLQVLATHANHIVAEQQKS